MRVLLALLMLVHSVLMSAQTYAQTAAMAAGPDVASAGPSQEASTANHSSSPPQADPMHEWLPADEWLSLSDLCARIPVELPESESARCDAQYRSRDMVVIAAYSQGLSHLLLLARRGARYRYIATLSDGSPGGSVHVTPAFRRVQRQGNTLLIETALVYDHSYVNQSHYSTATTEFLTVCTTFRGDPSCVLQVPLGATYTEYANPHFSQETENWWHHRQHAAESRGSLRRPYRLSENGSLHLGPTEGQWPDGIPSNFLSQEQTFLVRPPRPAAGDWSEPTRAQPTPEGEGRTFATDLLSLCQRLGEGEPVRCRHQRIRNDLFLLQVHSERTNRAYLVQSTNAGVSTVTIMGDDTLAGSDPTAFEVSLVRIDNAPDGLMAIRFREERRHPIEVSTRHHLLVCRTGRRHVHGCVLRVPLRHEHHLPTQRVDHENGSSIFTQQEITEAAAEATFIDGETLELQLTRGTWRQLFGEEDAPTTPTIRYVL